MSHQNIQSYYSKYLSGNTLYYIEVVILKMSFILNIVMRMFVTGAALQSCLKKKLFI